MKHFILDATGVPVETQDLKTWSAWVKNAHLTIRYETHGPAQIITRFQPLIMDDAKVEYWETTVEGGAYNGLFKSCSGTREQAEAMHEEILNQIKTS